MAALPPLSEVIDVMRTAVMPAAGVAALVYFVASLLPVVRRTPLPAALAIACGFVAGNWQREAVDFLLPGKSTLRFNDLWQSLQAAVTGSNPNGAAIPAPRYWLPWIVVAGWAAQLAGGLSSKLGWLLKFVVAALAGWLVAATESPSQHAIYAAGFAALSLCIWWLLDDLEAGALLPFTASLAAGAAGVLMLYAHWASFLDIGVLASSALLGVAIVAWWFQTDARAAAAIPALGIPVLMLLAQQNATTQVPALSYSLMAAAPLALGVLCLPGFRNATGRGKAMLTMLLWLAPAGAALYLAARAVPLNF